MTQGKIEGYRRFMKNLSLLITTIVLLNRRVGTGVFVDYDNNHRYHEALKNSTSTNSIVDMTLMECTPVVRQQQLGQSGRGFGFS